MSCRECCCIFQTVLETGERLCFDLTHSSNWRRQPRAKSPANWLACDDADNQSCSHHGGKQAWRTVWVWALTGRRREETKQRSSGATGRFCLSRTTQGYVWFTRFGRTIHRSQIVIHNVIIIRYTVSSRYHYRIT